MMLDLLRKIPPPLWDVVDSIVKRMLQEGTIKPSKSPWASPITIVKKKDGIMRFCIDYHKLNSVTKEEPFPLPYIQD